MTGALRKPFDYRASWALLLAVTVMGLAVGPTRLDGGHSVPGAERGGVHADR
jgi:hypothetical protein